MNILDKVVNISDLLAELETFGESVGDNLSYYDSKMSDLYHFLEGMTLNSKHCYRFCKELKQVLKERREFKQNLSMYQKYKAGCQKLISGKDNRNIFMAFLHKENKTINMPYKNRIYSEEELKNIMEG